MSDLVISIICHRFFYIIRSICIICVIDYNVSRSFQPPPSYFPLRVYLTQPNQTLAKCDLMENDRFGKVIDSHFIRFCSLLCWNRNEMEFLLFFVFGFVQLKLNHRTKHSEYATTRSNTLHCVHTEFTLRVRRTLRVEWRLSNYRKNHCDYFRRRQND